MPKRKDYTKDQIYAAMNKTRSVKAAARYLGCSYQHLKPWMKFYKDEATGKTLFELHKNQCGKGIPKFIKSKVNDPALINIIEGRIDSSLFDPLKLKWRLINEGFLEEKCATCGFEERRVLDYKVPLILHFKNGHKTDFSLGNIELLCYNHYFLMVGDIFNKQDIDQLETHSQISKTTEAVEMELDEYQYRD